MMVYTENDLGLLPLVVGISAYASIALVWTGASLLWTRYAHIGRWLFVSAVALAWIALVIGFGVAFQIGQRYSGTTAPLMVWVFAYLIPGVWPVTAAMVQAFKHQREPDQ